MTYKNDVCIVGGLGHVGLPLGIVMASKGLKVCLQDINKENAENKAPLSQIKVLAFKDKGEWDLQAKYNIGKKIDDEGAEV